MIHPSTYLAHISEQKGFGVIAKEDIPKGTITWVHDKMDMVFNPLKIRELGIEYSDIIETYTFRDNRGNHVLCWDHGKYVNHSYNSNCLTTPYNFEIAIRDIKAGEELTDDYGYLNITKPFKGVEEDGSRDMVYPDDLLRLHEEWDSKLADSFYLINEVDQPLLKFLPEFTTNKISKILTGLSVLDSIRDCYFDPN